MTPQHQLTKKLQLAEIAKDAIKKGIRKAYRGDLAMSRRGLAEAISHVSFVYSC
jgi:hypothetical protein